MWMLSIIHLIFFFCSGRRLLIKNKTKTKTKITGYAGLQSHWFCVWPNFPFAEFFAFCFVLFCLSLLSSKETDVNFESTFTPDNQGWVLPWEEKHNNLLVTQQNNYCSLTGVNEWWLYHPIRGFLWLWPNKLPPVWKDHCLIYYTLRSPQYITQNHWLNIYWVSSVF